MTIINTGGTFNKIYDPLSGKLIVPIHDDAIEAIVSKFTYPVSIVGAVYKDSLQMDEADRLELVNLIRSIEDRSVVVVHGTDTMDITADYLAQSALDKVVVLTGAMVPFSIDPVEATANLAMAMGVAQTSDQRGVYISMQGVVGPYDCIVKNRKTGKFERVEVEM